MKVWINSKPVEAEEVYIEVENLSVEDNTCTLMIGFDNTGVTLGLAEQDTKDDIGYTMTYSYVDLAQECLN